MEEENRNLIQDREELKAQITDLNNKGLPADVVKALNERRLALKGLRDEFRERLRDDPAFTLDDYLSLAQTSDFRFLSAEKVYRLLTTFPEWEPSTAKMVMRRNGLDPKMTVKTLIGTKWHKGDPDTKHLAKFRFIYSNPSERFLRDQVRNQVKVPGWPWFGNVIDFLQELDESGAMIQESVITPAMYTPKSRNTEGDPKTIRDTEHSDESGRFAEAIDLGQMDSDSDYPEPVSEYDSQRLDQQEDDTDSAEAPIDNEDEDEEARIAAMLGFDDDDDEDDDDGDDFSLGSLFDTSL